VRFRDADGRGIKKSGGDRSEKLRQESRTLSKLWRARRLRLKSRDSEVGSRGKLLFARLGERKAGEAKAARNSANLLGVDSRIGRPEKSRNNRSSPRELLNTGKGVRGTVALGLGVFFLLERGCREEQRPSCKITAFALRGKRSLRGQLGGEGKVVGGEPRPGKTESMLFLTGEHERKSVRKKIQHTIVKGKRTGRGAWEKC